MKIAYLILAYHQPAHLFRLVNALQHKDVKFFIHIDLKSDISKFTCFSYPENVHFIEERVISNHCGYSCVEAMVLLMNSAYTASDSDYFVFLTGSDYPIKSSEFIHNFLLEHYPVNFLSFYLVTERSSHSEFVTQFYFVDFISSCPQIFAMPLRAVRKALSLVISKRKFIDGCKPYRGATHFTLNRDTIAYVLEFLKTEKSREFVKYFKYCFSPDEQFFHTIILNSKYAEQCLFYERDFLTERWDENRAFLHYIDWDQRRENPAILVEGDFPKLKESSFLFARKFSEAKSKGVLELIDATLR